MKQILAILFLVPSLGATGIAEIEAEKADARAALIRIYVAEETERYCRRHPDETYPATYRDQPVEIDCKFRNAWVDRHTAAERERLEHERSGPD